MVRKLTLIVCVGAIFSAAAWATAARADEAALTDMFGAGVHAFNSRNYRQAYSDFAAAIEAGSRDPRVYYFRGLCNLSFGRAKDAQNDFGVGSQLEATDLDHFYDVSKSLERVQGRSRVTVEQYRSQARVAAVREREKLRIERYSVLRPGEGGASEGVSTPAASAQPSAPTATPMPADPFAAPSSTPSAPAKPAADPFGAAAPAAPAPAAPAVPAAEAPAAPAVPAPAAPVPAVPAAEAPAAPAVPAPAAPAVPAPVVPAVPAADAPAAPAPAAPAVPAAEPSAPAASGGAGPTAPAPAAPAAPGGAAPAEPSPFK